MISSSMVIKAPAKINLFLEVNKKRADGYHNLSSIMQSISLHDTLEVFLSSDNSITVEVIDSPFLSNEKNISYKAAQLFMSELGKSYGVKIIIDKKIPVLAGLAGGSADAAATLLALNKMLENPFSKDDLLSMGKRLGADVPFCIYQGTALVSGIGDIIVRCDLLPQCFIIILKAHNKISTADMFCKLDALKYRKINNINNMLEALKQRSINQIGKEMYNVFSALDDTENDSIKNRLLAFGATGVCLSGSGPSIIGLFEFQHDAEIAHTYFVENGILSYIVEPISNYTLL